MPVFPKGSLAELIYIITIVCLRELARDLNDPN